MNNNIADTLIYGKESIDSSSHATSAAINTSGSVSGSENGNHDNVVVSSDNRVVATRYKIYIITFILLGLFVFYKMLVPARDIKEKVNREFLSKKMEVEQFEQKKAVVEKNLVLLKILEKEENKLVDCINTKDSCANSSILKKILTGNTLGIVKSYLNLSDLSNERMVINEKKILENLNDFLLRKDIDVSTYNGEIEKINIGEEDTFDDIIFYAPVDLRIIFDNKDDLLSFVDNIESRILPDKETRILYQIENIKYDILRSSEKQSVDIALYMFYTR